MAKGKRPNDLAGIACPHCGSKANKITDSREAPHNQIRRRRACECGQRFSTYENVDDDRLEFDACP
jgi:transcriptional regulator NrdR family protein